MSPKIRHFHIPIFIPDFGCPFRCIFCNQKTITSTNTYPSASEIQSQIERWLTSIPTVNSIVEVAFFGGNFTGIPVEIQHKYLATVAPFLESKRVQSIRISTRPDAITEEILLRLKDFGVKSIELGAQSLNNNVLLASRRGHTAEDVIQASALILKHKFTLGLQMMVGLPTDSAKIALDTAQKIIEIGAHETRIYPLLVIKNTELENLYRQGIYTPLTIEEAVDQTAPIYELFEKNNVIILKVGLHPSEGFVSGKELVSGPYHPNFRELVISKIWQNRILNQLNTINQGKKLIIRVNSSDINGAIGFKSRNKLLFQGQFSEVKYLQDNDLPKGDFLVSVI